MRSAFGATYRLDEGDSVEPLSGSQSAARYAPTGARALLRAVGYPLRGTLRASVRFAHKNGGGFDIVLEALPINGRITLREPKAGEPTDFWRCSAAYTSRRSQFVPLCVSEGRFVSSGHLVDARPSSTQESARFSPPAFPRKSKTLHESGKPVQIPPLRGVILRRVFLEKRSPRNTKPAG